MVDFPFLARGIATAVELLALLISFRLCYKRVVQCEDYMEEEDVIPEVRLLLRKFLIFTLFSGHRREAQTKLKESFRTIPRIPRHVEG